MHLLPGGKGSRKLTCWGLVVTRFRMRFLLIAAALSGLAAPASSTASPQSDYSIKETRRLAYDYAKCVVGHDSAAASEALLSDASNEEILTRYKGLIDGACLVRSTHAGAKMSFPGDLYRYALADALVSRELASSPVPDLSNVPALERRALPEKPAPLSANASKADRRRYEKELKDYGEAEAFRTLGALGECTVRLDAAGAKALLLTAPETAAEASSFGALGPTLAQCLPEGTRLELGKLALRGTIAVNYYRLAHAAASAAAR